MLAVNAGDIEVKNAAAQKWNVLTTELTIFCCLLKGVPLEDSLEVSTYILYLDTLLIIKEKKSPPQVENCNLECSRVCTTAEKLPASLNGESWKTYVARFTFVFVVPTLSCKTRKTFRL